MFSWQAILFSLPSFVYLPASFFRWSRYLFLCGWIQVPIHMHKVQYIKYTIVIDIVDSEARSCVKVFVVFVEDKHVLYKLLHRDFGFVVSSRHPEVEKFTKELVLYTDDVLDVLCEILFNKHCNSVLLCSWYLVFL